MNRHERRARARMLLAVDRLAETTGRLAFEDWTAALGFDGEAAELRANVEALGEEGEKWAGAVRALLDRAELRAGLSGAELASSPHAAELRERHRRGARAAALRLVQAWSAARLAEARAARN